MSKSVSLVGMEIRNKFYDLFHSDKKGWSIVVYEKGEVREE